MTDNQLLAIVNQLERIADALESIDETLFAGGKQNGQNIPTEGPSR